MEKLESLRLELVHFLDYLKEKYNITEQEIFESIGAKSSPNLIPLCIFTRKLGVLESVVKYLKENIGLKNNEIASLLNKNQRTIWSTYQHAKRKVAEKFVIKPCKTIPVSVIRENYGPLELVSEYLKEKEKMSFHQIAEILERDDRTIWASYHKIKVKRNAK